MIKILTVGVFDYFHYGHLRLFLQARGMSDDTYLIVAVQNDEFIKKYKPDTNIFYSVEIRKELISALRCVDEVIEYTDVQDIVRNVDFDIFAVGADQNHMGFQMAIQWCKENNKRVVRLQRTPGIASSKIKQYL
ncbi:MAG: adenylyltransferase/cytidyltransferase family protein [Alphaproteobacteria bacterium]|nr:adenylyltransferase/cytidyltransferase family protein [Alphaproteobacteria bacterium]